MHNSQNMKLPRAQTQTRPSVNCYTGVNSPRRSQTVFPNDDNYPVVPEPEYTCARDWRPCEAPSLMARSFGKRNVEVQPQVGSIRLIQSGILSGGSRRVLEALASSAVMEERNRLAREIHDTLVQEFAGILLHLEAAKGCDTAGRYSVSECLARARELAKSGLEDARRMLLGLRPKSLEGAPLPDALRQLAERFSRDCGISCTFRRSGRTRELPEDIQDELYRVAQEALCNVRKHSHASSVTILLSYNPREILLTVEDNGQGFAAIKPQAGAQGFGLPTMCDRACRLGGRMDIISGPGKGTEIKIAVPQSGKTPN